MRHSLAALPWFPAADTISVLSLSPHLVLLVSWQFPRPYDFAQLFDGEHVSG